MPVSPYRFSAFDRIVIFLATERTRIGTTPAARPKPLCPDKSSK